MTKRFDFTLNWKQIAVFWYLLLVTTIVFNVYSYGFIKDHSQPVMINSMNESEILDYYLELFKYFGISLLYGIFSTKLIVPIYRRIIGNTVFNGANFTADFSAGKLILFMFWYIGYLLLVSVFTGAITLMKLPILILISPFIYLFLALLNTKLLVEYIVKKTGYNSDKFVFQGSLTGLIIVWLKILVTGTLLWLFTYVYSMISLQSASVNTGTFASILANTFLRIFSFFFGSVIFLLNLEWVINIKYKDFNIKLSELDIMDYFRYAGEVTLGIITLGFYMPKAIQKILSHFLPKINVANENRKIALDFEGNSKDDYLFLLKQTLYSVLSLGIYSPLAIERMGKWTLSNIIAEDLCNESTIDDFNDSSTNPQPKEEQQIANIQNSEDI